MKTMMAVLMVCVMALTACSGGGDGMPLPTSMAGEGVTESAEVRETADAGPVASEEVAAETGGTDLVPDISDTAGTDTVETENATETEDVSDTVVETEAAGSTEGVIPDVAADTEESSVTPEPVEEPAREEVKPVHTHSYTGSVTVNPVCDTAGVMTYVCGCGDSYTEPIAAAGHQWTATTETVHHPSMGHMERTEKQVTKMKCRCGYVTEDNADFQAHRLASLDACNTESDLRNCPCAGPELYWWETVYEDNWVVTQEEYDEIITKTVCVVCGLTQ